MIVKGPFNITWGANTLEDVTEVNLTIDTSSDTFATLAHKNREIDGPRQVNAAITLLSTDIEALAIVLPQYFVAQGQSLSTGETVDSSVGAIDMIDQCDEPVYHDLEIVSCGNPGQVLRLVNTRTRLNGVTNPATARTVEILFVGEAEQGQGDIQFFLNGGISPVS